MPVSQRMRRLLESHPSWVLPDRLLCETELRSGMVADMQLVCGFGDYELDVLVRGYSTPQILDIAGQITRSGRVHEPVPDLALELVDGRAASVVSATNTNAFGEFGFSSRPRGVYGIRVGEESDAPCVLVWEGL